MLRSGRTVTLVSNIASVACGLDVRLVAWTRGRTGSATNTTARSRSTSTPLHPRPPTWLSASPYASLTPFPSQALDQVSIHAHAACPTSFPSTFVSSFRGIHHGSQRDRGGTDPGVAHAYNHMSTSSSSRVDNRDLSLGRRQLMI